MFHERIGFEISAALPDRRRLARSLFRTERRPEETITLLGQSVDLVRPEEVMHHVGRWVRAGRKAIVANHNLHSLYLVRRDPALRRFFQRADLTQLDSTPLVWFARLLGLSSRPFHRCTYLDWRDHFWSLANREGWRVMYVGGAPGVAERAAQSLSARAPGATIAVAPRWMGRIGLEWLFRLVVDPKRLFTRYCIEPWSLLGPALADLRAARSRNAAL